MVDSTGTTKYSYTAGNQLLTEDGPFASDTVTSIYFSRMRTNLSLQQPTGVWTNKFGWDAAKRLTNVTSQAGSFTNEYFAGVGGASGFSSRLIKRQLLPNLSIITNDFDSVARQLGTWLRTSAGTLLDSNVYSYNAASQRITFTNAGKYYQYTFDKIGQLTGADSSDNGEDRSYVYDPAWNLTNRSGSTFVVDNKNELTNAYGAMTYDSNGNLITSGNARYEYTYDDENQLIQRLDNGHFIQQPPKLTQFIYDGKNRLRVRLEYTWVCPPPESPSLVDPDTAVPPPDECHWELDSETHYIYDGNRVIQERNGNNVPTVSYTRGNDLSGTFEGAGGIGGLLARSDGYSGGNWTSHTFYHADGNGNITYLADSSQGLAASYRYDPFGTTIAQSGPLADANVYRFSSKEIHVVSGLYYYLYRFYSPNWQRWVNQDPIEEEGGLNLYGFAENGPVSFLDPDGGKPMTFPVRRPMPPPIELPPWAGPVGGPIIVCGAVTAVVIDVGSKLYYDEKKKRCDKEWDDAFKMCKEELSKPNPSRGITGGYNNIMDCARGHVSEECGGNPVDHGKRKKKPRTIRF